MYRSLLYLYGFIYGFSHHVIIKDGENMISVLRRCYVKSRSAHTILMDRINYNDHKLYYL